MSADSPSLLRCAAQLVLYAAVLLGFAASAALLVLNLAFVVVRS